MKNTSNNMRIEDFKIYNHWKVLFWLVNIYAINIALSISLSLLYRMLFPQDIGDLNNITTYVRAFNLFIILIAIFFLQKRHLRISRYIILVILFIGFSLQILFPNPTFIVAIVSFTVTVIVTEYILTALFMKSKLTIIFGISACLSINAYAYYLSIIYVDKPLFLTSLMIPINYLVVTISIFNLFVTVGNHRFTDYLENLIYSDLKTGYSNERRFIHEIKELIKKKEKFSLLCLHITNLSDLNNRHSYRVAHERYLNFLFKIEKQMSFYGRPYKLEGPVIAFLVRCGSLDEKLKNTIMKNQQDAIKDSNQIQFDYKWLATSFPEDGEDQDKLLNNIYHLKHVSKDKQEIIHWYDHIAFKQAKRLLTLEKDLVKAIENRLIDIVIQPQFDLINNKLHGVEVLARWEHIEFGEVSPIEFVPLVERMGLADSFTKVVLEKAKSAFDTISLKNISLDRISINVIASTITDGTLLELVEGWSDHLEIEITESTLMDLSEDAQDILSQVKSKGHAIAIDDFGTGYSNLEYLHKLDVNFLKIDKRFIDSMMVNEKAMKLVEALLSMSHALNIKVIAEGVETKMQYDILKSLGCDIVQGYYYSRPLCLKDFLEQY